MIFPLHGFFQSPKNSFICKADCSLCPLPATKQSLRVQGFKMKKLVGPIFLQLTIKYITATLSSVYYQILFQYSPPFSCWTELIQIIPLRCFCINLVIISKTQMSQYNFLWKKIIWGKGRMLIEKFNKRQHWKNVE